SPPPAIIISVRFGIFTLRFSGAFTICAPNSAPAAPTPGPVCAERPAHGHLPPAHPSTRRAPGPTGFWPRTIPPVALSPSDRNDSPSPVARSPAPRFVLPPPSVFPPAPSSSSHNRAWDFRRKHLPTAAAPPPAVSPATGIVPGAPACQCPAGPV